MKRLGLVAAIFSVLSTPALATTYVENPDASAYLSDAQWVPGGTTTVSGEIVNVGLDSDVDLYKIGVAGTGQFTIKALEIDAALDMNLLVFNAKGQFLAGDDDDRYDCDDLGVGDSCLALNLSPGVYYFAVGDNNIGAYTTEQEYLDDEQDFADNDSGILAEPSTEIMFMVGDESGRRDDIASLNDEGAYSVTFSRQTVRPFTVTPVPTLPLFGFGILVSLLGLFGLRKLRQ
jgi:hypothetical protein